MKYLKLYESFDFNDEDFDFEEYPEIENDFVKFLKNEQIYDIFIENFYNEKIMTFFRLKNKNKSLENYIENVDIYKLMTYAFNWRYSPQDYGFWNNIDNRWMKYVKLNNLYESFDFNDEDFDFEEYPENDFVKFLKNEQIYDIFIENFYNEKSTPIYKRSIPIRNSLENYIKNTKKLQLILYAFTWLYSPQNYFYWQTINNKWINYVKYNIPYED